MLTFRPYTADDVKSLTKTINDAYVADRFFKLPQYYDRADDESLTTNLVSQEKFYNTYIVGALDAIDDDTGLNVCAAALVTHNFSFRFTYTIEDPSIVKDDDAGSEDDDDDEMSFITKQYTVEDLLEGKIDKATFAPFLTEFDSDATNINKKLIIHSIRVLYRPAISTVSVHRQFQKRGYGKQLVHETEQYCLQQYFKNQTLQNKINTAVNHLLQLAEPVTINFQRLSRVISQIEVLLAVRPDLGPFYLSQGYRIIEEIPFTYKHICLPEYDFNSTLMEKQLK